MTQLYHCLSITTGQLDWRELLCSIHALENTRYLYENPSKLLFSFFKLYTSPGGSAIRSDVVRIISIAAVTHAEFTRMMMVGHHLPRFVKLSEFQNFLAINPHTVNAFRLQLWNQLPDSSKLRYLQSREDATARWFCQYAHQINLESATTFRYRSTLRWFFVAWCKFHEGLARIQLQQRTVSLRKCKTFILWWHSYTTQQRISHARRHSAAVLGERAIMRRVLRTKWHRYSCIKGRLRQFTTNFKSHSVEIAHGGFILRHTMTSNFRRKAMIRWLNWIANAIQWDNAGMRMHMYIRRRILKQWIAHFRAVRGFRVGEEESINKQIWLASAMKQAEKANMVVMQGAENARLTAIAEKKRNAASVKMDLLAWNQRRRQAERAADDRIKLAAQQDMRAKRIAQEKEDRAVAFKAAWEALENMYIKEHQRATISWLDSSSSKSHVSKAFKRIKREFYQPPTPRSINREAQLKSLTSIVLIRMESVLFQKGIVMGHLIQQYAESSCGFLSHDEFKSLVRDLPIDLSPEQIRVVIGTLDADNDGYLGVGELENALHQVHKYNGVSASPWRMYIDPAQDVMCYHNLATSELVFEHRMHDTKLMEITKSNFIAETELEAINHIRRERALVILPTGLTA